MNTIVFTHVLSNVFTDFLKTIGSPVFWLVLLVVLILIEVFTLGLTTIWFAGGSLVALILSMFHVNVAIQFALFLVVSFVLLFFTRPYAVKHLNKRTTKTNVESLAGEKAVVTKTIDNLKGQGEITINGLPWTARSADNEKTIEAGSTVIIEKIEGVKAIVRLI